MKVSVFILFLLKALNSVDYHLWNHKNYSPAELVGRKFLVLCNLKPSALESNLKEWFLLRLLTARLSSFTKIDLKIRLLYQIQLEPSILKFSQWSFQ